MNFRCDVNGYPVPDISWIFSKTNTLLQTDENVFKSNYVITKANCLHTGPYLCMGSNVIGGELGNAFSEIDLFVLCKYNIKYVCTKYSQYKYNFEKKVHRMTSCETTVNSKHLISHIMQFWEMHLMKCFTICIIFFYFLNSSLCFNLRISLTFFF